MKTNLVEARSLRKDFRTDKEQGEQLFVALKKLGLDAELILFPEETHDLSRSGRTDRLLTMSYQSRTSRGRKPPAWVNSSSNWPPEM